MVGHTIMQVHTGRIHNTTHGITLFPILVPRRRKRQAGTQVHTWYSLSSEKQQEMGTFVLMVEFMWQALNIANIFATVYGIVLHLDQTGLRLHQDVEEELLLCNMYCIVRDKFGP